MTDSPLSITLDTAVATVGGQLLTLGRIKLRHGKKLVGDLQTLRSFAGGLPTDEQIDAMIRLVHASVQAKNPGTTFEAVEALFLDHPGGMVVALTELAEAFTKMQEISVPAPEPQDGASGEVVSP